MFSFICDQQYTNVTPLDVSNLQNQMEILLSQLRPNAVGIVDSFDFHDETLRSTLGAWDGQVYERMFEAASKSPLNKDPVNESFQKYLKPLLKSSL
jgi:acyl-CoA oxidase